MLTKQDYISRFRNRNCSNESRMRFLKDWCEEEGRSFQELNVILNVLPNQSSTIAGFFDLKYRVTLLHDKKGVYLGVVSNVGKEKLSL